MSPRLQAASISLHCGGLVARPLWGPQCAGGQRGPKGQRCQDRLLQRGGWAGGSKTGEALGSSARLQYVPAPLGGPSEGSYWKANSEAGRPAGQERALGHPCRRGVPRDRVTRQGRSPSAPPACRARPLLAAGPSCALRGVLQHRCLGRLGAGSTAPATVTGSVRRRGRTSSGRTAGPVENHWPRGARVLPSRGGVSDSGAGLWQATPDTLSCDSSSPPDPHAHRSSCEERLGSLPTPCFGSTEVIGNSCSHHEENILPAIKETFTSKHTSDIPHKVNRHCVPPLQPEGHINATGGSLRSSTKYRK